LSTKLEEALYELGGELEKAGWEPDDGMPEIFEKGENDPKSSRIFRARLFVRKIQGHLKSAICLPKGGVNPKIKLAGEMAKLCTAVVDENTTVNISIDPLVDVLIDLNLEIFCASP